MVGGRRKRRSDTPIAPFYSGINPFRRAPDELKTSQKGPLLNT
jgi:hypothetical protein